MCLRLTAHYFKLIIWNTLSDHYKIAKFSAIVACNLVQLKHGISVYFCLKPLVEFRIIVLISLCRLQANLYLSKPPAKRARSNQSANSFKEIQIQQRNLKIK